MKSVNFFLSCIFAASMATAFTGCSSDDSFAAPTIEAGSVTSGSIDLSDGTTFSLPVNIVSEGGLKSIVVTDSEGKIWANITEFTDTKSVKSVNLDLSACPETKILLLTVTATDNAGQVTKSTSQYSLNVYVPVLYVNADPVVTLTEKANINVRIGRGVKKLASMSVKVNDGTASTIDLSTDASQKSLLKSVELTGLTTGKNKVVISVFEEGSTTAASVETCNVNRAGGVQETIRFTDDKGNLTKYQVRRNDKGNVEFISVTPPAEYDEETYMPLPYIVHDWNFTYNDNNLVTEIEDDQVTTTLDFETFIETSEHNKHLYKFAYNTMNELTGVTLDGNAYVTDVVYKDGLIATYKINGDDYAPKYRTAGGVTVRTDILDKALSGKDFNFDGTEEMNPYYNAGLPAVIPGNIEGLPIQLLYSEYLFKSSTSGWNAGWTNGDGFQSTKFTLDGTEWTMKIIAE